MEMKVVKLFWLHLFTQKPSFVLSETALEEKHTFLVNIESGEIYKDFLLIRKYIIIAT